VAQRELAIYGFTHSSRAMAGTAKPWTELSRSSRFVMRAKPRANTHG